MKTGTGVWAWNSYFWQISAWFWKKIIFTEPEISWIQAQQVFCDPEIGLSLSDFHPWKLQRIQPMSSTGLAGSEEDDKYLNLVRENVQRLRHLRPHCSGVDEGGQSGHCPSKWNALPHQTKIPHIPFFVILVLFCVCPSLSTLSTFGTYSKCLKVRVRPLVGWARC